MIIIVQDYEVVSVSRRPRLTTKYVGTMFVRHTKWPVTHAYEVFEGWGCRVLEHYPGQQGVHVGRYLGEEGTP
jgi:hypothetical protein